MIKNSICQHLVETSTKYENLAAIHVAKKKTWVAYTWGEYFTKISKVASALEGLGVKQGTKLAILSSTRAEWSYCDHAILGLGAITVPIYQNITAEDLKFYLNDSESEYLFIETKHHVSLWNEIKAECPSVKQVIGFPGLLRHIDMPWKDLIASARDGHVETFKKHCSERQLDDIATIVYTSGTSGSPKGVVLTHRQILSEVEETFPLFDVSTEDKTLSFLPYAHVLGRIEHWGHAFCGFQMAYAESFERIKQNIQSVQPTILIAVPRVFEKIHSRILTQAQGNYTKRKLFNWAVDVGIKVSRLKSQHQSVPPHIFVQFEAAKRLVFQPIYEALGGRIRFAICGGAPLAKEVAEFFDAIGILILEGYGLTETTAAVCVNRPYDYEFGTVGKPIGDVELKIAEDGEILVRSDKVMKEYYQRPEDTARALNDGWFSTGDIGEINSSGRLKITDRKKDLIKTAAGKYVAPQKLEKLLSQHPLISHVLIHGDARKYIVALVTLDEVNLKDFAQRTGISYSDTAQLTSHGSVQKEIRSYVTEVNAKLASFESIKKFKILPRDFNVEEGELTNSLKVKRKFLDQKHRELLDSLY